MTSFYKKGGFRPMNQMNGDFLAQLKEPLRSEVNRNVVGTNKATIALMNRRLDMYYKEKNFNIERIRRGQDSVYNTMLRVTREKKMLQRAMHKRNQEEARLKLNKQEMKEVSDIELENNKSDDPEAEISKSQNAENFKEQNKKQSQIVKSDLTEAKLKQDNSVTQDLSQKDNVNNGTKEVSISKTKPKFEKKSKVLEVSKKTPFAPITRERSDLAAESIPKSEAPTKLHQHKPHSVLPKITDENEQLPNDSVIADIAINSVAKAQTQNNDLMFHLKPVQSTDEGFTEVSISAGPGKRASKSSMAMPTISEKDQIRDSQTRHSDGSINVKRKRKKYKNKRHEQQIQMAFVETVTEKGTESRVKHVTESLDEDNDKKASLSKKLRKRAQERILDRYRTLNDEHIPVYIKDSKGYYIPSKAPFRRREFNPPTQKEKYFQEKMLRAQVDARLDQRRKLEDFFERMAHEEQEKERLREAFRRTQKAEADDARRKQTEDQQKLNFNASQLATLYSKGILPEGVDPNSFEAIKYCKYIRTYSPTSNELARRIGEQEGGVSSWSNRPSPTKLT